MLTVYESQRRLTRNFLEGARKKRVSYTPRGLYDAWRGLDAARKVYLATLIGWVVTVRSDLHESVEFLLITTANPLDHTFLWLIPLPRGVRLLWEAFELLHMS